tara:strand:+ start:189 stop:1355 length:1167 start_codon:yes stop_codon:yes gene_type:complete
MQPTTDKKIDYSKKFEGKVFVIITNTFKFMGGAERQALILADYLVSEIGAEVHFIAFEDGDKLKNLIEAIGCKWKYIPLNFYKSKIDKAYSYIKLVSYINKIKGAVLIPYAAISNKVVGQIFKKTNASFSFWNQRDEGRSLFNTKNEKKALFNVSAIVSNSFEGRDFLVNQYNIPKHKINVINNGIKSDFDNKNIDWHKKLNTDKQALIVSMIANVHSFKDHLTLLYAWRIVLSNYNDKRPLILVLAGTLGPTVTKLKVLGFDLNLSQNLIFAGPVDDVRSLISASYMCVFSSNLEGCPNGVLECMEQGKVVVGTNISGLRQAMGKNYAAMCLSEPNNPNSLAEKILGIINNNELRIEIGLYNERRILEEFSVEQMVNNYLDLIKIKI